MEADAALAAAGISLDRSDRSAVWGRPNPRLPGFGADGPWVETQWTNNSPPPRRVPAVLAPLSRSNDPCGNAGSGGRRLSDGR